jgi:hypothetical protein
LFNISINRMKTKLLALTFFSSLVISGFLSSCTKGGDNHLAAVDTTGIGTFPKTWLDGTWKMVKDVEMPDHGSDTTIYTTGCRFSILTTFNKGGYSAKSDPTAIGCPVIKEVRYRYTLSADSNTVLLFRIGTDKAAGGFTYTSHTDSTYFTANRGGNIWFDQYYEKQK